MSIRRGTLRTSAAFCRLTPNSGYNGLYDPSRSTGPIIAALCWAHARRQFFELVDIGANARRRKGTAAISPLALEAVKRIDALFDIERGINGLTADERLRIRRPGSSLQGQMSVISRLRSSDVLLINSLVLRTPRLFDGRPQIGFRAALSPLRHQAQKRYMAGKKQAETHWISGRYFQVG